MKKIRVGLLVFVLLLSFNVNGFAAEGKICESNIEALSSTKPIELTAKVIDYETMYYRADGHGGFMPGPREIFYKEIKYENGYELIGTTREVIGSRDGSGYWIRFKSNYRTY